VEAAGDLRHREQRLRHGNGSERLRSLAEELFNRGSVFGIPGEQVDGMDVRAVKAAAITPPSIAARARGRSFSK
jgi:TPP-dependent pyruvate/acetoin dehydrogenase alpha subunit